ncbi:MAG: response regulator transcription factor [Actinobacteria bacterium]|nr:response regulator transcription factor [Actinomycetota bacterium]
MTTDGSTRVLVVEDDPDLRELYADYLRDRYAVTAVATGEAALERVADGVEVVLLDRRLPGLDGSGVLKEIRERSAGCAVAVVTGVEPGLDILDMGFDDYVRKPVSRGDLLALVERMDRWREYDGAVRRYFATATTVALIESRGPEASGLQAEDAQLLRERLAAAEAEAERGLEQAIGANGIEAVLQRIVRAD